MKKLLWVIQLFAVVAVCPVAVQAASLTPENVVVSTTDQVLQVLRGADAGENPQSAYDTIDHLIVPHIDFQQMSQKLLGEHWSSATAEQKENFVTEFRKLLVKTYATTLQQYAKEKIAYLSEQVKQYANVATVRSQVIKDAGSPVSIDYRLHQQNGEWKVFDVAVDGVSLVANYRVMFDQEISTLGIDGLISTLSAHNQLL
ncbi:MAG TPA: ABC transporter substrate-binding protein [Gammaproteobacteria bacterium]|nr:ABC transporter substrate-binding protein [Gammaproteobacteria bacterium]